MAAHAPAPAGSGTPAPDLGQIEYAALATLIEELGHPRFHAAQVYRWIWRRGVTDPEAMTDLPRALRAALAGATLTRTPAIERRDESADGTQKFVLRLADGRRIESVFIPDTPKQTFCVSTQVGCAMGCRFCLTGRMGLVRHLDAGEIAGQVRVLGQALNLLAAPFNIVLMGMGEPLHNYAATMQAVRLLTDPRGLALPPRRITLSTVGIVPMLERLAAEPVMPNLAISLHAATDEKRAAVVPPARKYPLDAILDACRRFPVHRRRRITFEYVLLAGVNDSADDARRLATLLSDVRGKVNLIPLNAAAGIPFERPSDTAVNRFAAILAQRGLVVSVRRSRGRDIRAACGQLLVEGEGRRSPGQRLAEAL